ncbi:MAG: hypothetical protein JWN44_3410 [Myxococcales bacterium]|nr:hypothetical protein [Myxococcales bacterium]
MLRKAANPDDRRKKPIGIDASEPPASPRAPREDVRLWLGVHDLSRIEWTAAVQLPTAGERKYEVQLEVEIPATIFASHSVWEHLQIFTRLQSPAEEGPLEIERDDLEELRRDTLGVAHRLKRLGQRFERACVATAAQLLKEPTPALQESLTDLVMQSVDLMADMRQQLAPGTEARDEVKRECALADEFLSHALIDFFAGCERALDEVLFGVKSVLREADTPWSEDLRCLIAEGLAEELVHRRARGWLTPRADAPAELGQFLERASRLKKHFQDVLYLDVEAYFVDTRVRSWVGIVAAALAAVVWLSFTLLPIGPGTRAGLGIGTFAVVFAIAYAIKDRLKELTRGWITGRLMRLYGQRVVTLRLPRRIDPHRPQLLETRETFDVEAQPFDTEEVRGGNTIGRPRRVVRLKFRMRATLHSVPALARAHIFSIKHIFRYDLSPVFARLDNAVKQVPVLDAQRRVRFADAPREYRFPARIVFTAAEAGVPAEPIAHLAYLVVSKRGIERIEPRA